VDHAEGFRQYVCDGCGSVVIGIAVLRQLSGPVGQHIWTAEPVPPATAGPRRCPFCRTEMEAKTVPAGAAAICRADEVVWLDKLAATSLPVMNSGTHDQPTLEAQVQPARCQECGAPIQHTWDEKCPYCGAVIQAPTKVVVLTTDTDDDQRAGNSERHGLFGEVMKFVTRPVD
jgi:predicted RNA-binding Zn-ribbon protein involved in translation (DUF1610 family)